MMTQKKRNHEKGSKRRISAKQIEDTLFIALVSSDEGFAEQYLKNKGIDPTKLNVKLKK